MKQLNALLLGLSMVGTAVLPGVASAAVGITIDVAPPPPRVEAPPPPRMGFMWAPGFWDYRGHDHVWVPGHYVQERRGYHWVPDRWDQAGPHWRRVPGHWER